jgi:hypothetical protein
MLAAEKGRADAVKALLEAGADKDAKDEVSACYDTVATLLKINDIYLLQHRMEGRHFCWEQRRVTSRWCGRCWPQGWGETYLIR